MPGIPFKKGRRRCIFCGAFGVTYEHVWADWLKAYIPREQANHSMSQTHVSPEKPDKITLHKRTGDAHSHRVRRVCASCNNGWMSQLQEDAKEFLVPMLAGQPVRLHRRAQHILSAWIAMLVMVAEYMEPDNVTVPESDRRFLMETRKPPRHWRIWIACHRRQQAPLYSHNSLEFVQESEGFTRGPATNHNTQSSTICVGKHLVFHTMSSVLAYDLIRRWRLPSTVATGLDQIWPVRTKIVTWPRSVSLNDAGLTLLAHQLMDASQRFLRDLIGRSSAT